MSIVYRQDMPDVLPPRLFIQQLRKKLAFAITTTLRAILVSCIWLILLPYFTIWIWRLYFFLGANLSKHLSRLQRMKQQFGFSKKKDSASMILDLALGDDGDGILGNETMLIAPTWFEEYKSRFSLQ